MFEPDQDRTMIRAGPDEDKSRSRSGPYQDRIRVRSKGLFILSLSGPDLVFLTTVLTGKTKFRHSDQIRSGLQSVQNWRPSFQFEPSLWFPWRLTGNPVILTLWPGKWHDPWTCPGRRHCAGLSLRLYTRSSAPHYNLLLSTRAAQQPPAARTPPANQRETGGLKRERQVGLNTFRPVHLHTCTPAHLFTHQAVKLYTLLCPRPVVPFFTVYLEFLLSSSFSHYLAPAAGLCGSTHSLSLQPGPAALSPDTILFSLCYFWSQ